MSSPWASVVPDGHGTQGLPPPFRRPLCPSWRAGFSPIPTKSGASRASGLSRMSWERRRPGASVGREPDTAEDWGRDCGERRLELGANTYGVLVPRASTGGRDGGRGETVRGCVTWGEGSSSFLNGAAGKAWRPDPGCKRVVGGSWGLGRGYGWHQHEHDSPHGLEHPSM